MSSKGFTVLGVVLLALSGCGEKRIPTVPVSGKVLYRGQPAPGAQVVLHPVTRDPEQLFSATGSVQEDGAFKIGVNAAGDGAPPGEYVATVQWFKVVQTEGGAGPGPNVLPPQYGSVETSPLKVIVNKGPTELPPLELN
jgi:hypothetical protein